jgi:large subunit ribosomal protein L9
MSTHIEVLLVSDVPEVGKRGEIVRVSKGYARNYLLPRRLAQRPTAGNKKVFERDKERLVRRDAFRQSNAQEIASAVEKTSVTIETNANPEGHLYGSVDPRAIAEAFRKAGLAVAPDMVEIADPIRKVGVYSVTIRPHGAVTAAAKVWVVAAKDAEKSS